MEFSDLELINLTF